MSFNYGIEFETFLLSSEPKNLEIIETNVDHRQAIMIYLLGKNILCRTSDCPRSQNAQPQWVITDDYSVNIHDDVEDFDSANSGEFKIPTCVKHVDKLYHSLFTSSLNISSLKGTLLSELEIVSPPFVFGQNNSISELCTALSEEGSLYSLHNSKTSTHVHFSFNPSFTVDQIFNIYVAWWYFEPILMQLVPYWRRDNGYCTTIRSSIVKLLQPTNNQSNPPNPSILFMYDYDTIKRVLGVANNLNKCITVFQYMSDIEGNMMPYRHKTINMLNLITNRIGANQPLGTIEVRIKHGACDYEEIMKYVEFFGKFLLRAANESGSFFNNVYTGSTFFYKQILESIHVDSSVHFAILNEFMGPQMFDVMSYMHQRYRVFKIATYDSDTALYVPLPVGMSGGSKMKKSEEYFELNGKRRRIYMGPRGGRYIKIKNKYISIQHYMKKTT